ALLASSITVRKSAERKQRTYRPTSLRGVDATSIKFREATADGADAVVSSASMPDLAGLTTPSAPLRRLRGIFLMAQPPLLCEEGNVCAALVCRFRNQGASVKLTSKTRRGYDDEEHPNVFDVRCRGSRNVYAGDGAATSHIHEGRRADPPAALPSLSPRRHDCADVVVDL